MMVLLVSGGGKDDKEEDIEQYLIEQLDSSWISREYAVIKG